MAHRYVYAVWFSDDSLVPEDQDAEWVACILIAAEAPDEALAWGDRLAADYCARRPVNRVVRSSVTPEDAAEGDVASLPSIRVGDLATDEFIGW